MKTVAGFWEEHCLECAMPACYGTCSMYERGWHGRCVRVDGFEESVRGRGTFSLRRWGKVELMYHGALLDERRAVWAERMNRSLRFVWRMLGPWHRAVRWRLTKALGCRGVPDAWRLRMTSERDEMLCATVAYEDGREAMREVLPLKAGVERAFEFRLPKVEVGALFRIFALDGEATGTVRILENAVIGLGLGPRGRGVKCVAWDLDGTLWDGTLSEGDDVKLRPEAVETIKALDAAGIVNSICSKNDEAPAIAKLRELGVEEYFVFPQINWGPKSASLKNLAKEMNIGLEAIAFIDDREENRAEVRTNCPGVRVYDGCPPVLRDLEGLGRQEGLGSRRREMYREEMTRRGAAKRFGGDSAAFAEASGLTFELLPVEDDRIGRCRELVQRTNQLNLTARRYDETAFAALLASAECVAVRVWDKYGDYGIVGFLAMRGSHLVECCFSCRSAGRGLERKVLSAVASGRKLTADVVATERNMPIRAIVEEFL